MSGSLIRIRKPFAVASLSVNRGALCLRWKAGVMPLQLGESARTFVTKSEKERFVVRVVPTNISPHTKVHRVSGVVPTHGLQRLHPHRHLDKARLFLMGSTAASVYHHPDGDGSFFFVVEHPYDFDGRGRDYSDRFFAALDAADAEDRRARTPHTIDEQLPIAPVELEDVPPPQHVEADSSASTAAASELAEAARRFNELLAALGPAATAHIKSDGQVGYRIVHEG